MGESTGLLDHRLVVLLGNPGERYVRTRHNLGWRVGDVLAARSRMRFKAGKGDFYFAEGRIGGQPTRLLKPTTYVNESGRAVGQYGAIYGLVPKDMIVVVDDIALPLGLIRIRGQGSSGGHKGLASVIEHLGTEEVTRVRCGVGPVPDGVDSAQFVLDLFAADELIVVQQMATTAAAAVETILACGVIAAANMYNSKPPAPGQCTSPAPGADRPGEGK